MLVAMAVVVRYVDGAKVAKWLKIAKSQVTKTTMVRIIIGGVGHSRDFCLLIFRIFISIFVQRR